MNRYDVAVIGSGPAGHGAAIQATKLGKTAAVIERHSEIGGTSVNTGSIPSKALREAVLYLTGFRQRDIYGLSYYLKPDLKVQDLTARLDRVVRSEIDVIRYQFARNGVTLLRGEATFQDPNRLLIRREDGQSEIEADHIVIAVGTTPARSDKVPINGRTIIDTDSVFALQSIPRSMTIVGAGPIGVEYASVFAALDTKVTLVDQRHRILEFLDREILDALVYHLRQAGIILRLGEQVTEVIEGEGRIVAKTASKKRITSDVLLFAVGRQGATANLGLERIGLKPDERGRLQVDEHYRTEVPHVYAVGDVIGFPALASTSMEQGRLAVRYAFGVDLDPMPSLLPYGLYTIPEISMVGQTEEELTSEGVPYEIGLARYRETARGQIIGDKSGTLKLLVHSDTHKVLGVHIIGEQATELVHIGQVVIALQGTVGFLVNNTFNYPTLAECYRIAALDAYNKLR
ncbi:MAG: Si-specific NAD(P)(+) transhydrogenase [Dehalococcoidia bacterium]